ADACTGCETCLDRCQMGAIAVDDKDIARVDLDRCIGCGLCVTVCPEEALTLAPKSGADYRTPPESMTEQMMHLARKRGVI
ncbi:MAG: 4Fe-4S dicluster domain-containing protein, partial [Desulfobacteraceae bacterium]|nr:4Fe-4S dicluster domain-containing protein [Desulfobacteraceae bacterium]